MATVHRFLAEFGAICDSNKRCKGWISAISRHACCMSAAADRATRAAATGIALTMLAWPGGSKSAEPAGEQFGIERPSRAVATTIETAAVITPKLPSIDVNKLERATLQTDADRGQIRSIVTPHDPQAVEVKHRRLHFKNSTLVEIAAAFNRYNTVKIEVRQSAQTRRFTGIFDVQDPGSFMIVVSMEPDLDVAALRGRIIVGHNEPHR